MIPLENENLSLWHLRSLDNLDFVQCNSERFPTSFSDKQHPKLLYTYSQVTESGL